MNRQPRTSRRSHHRATSQPPNRNTTNPAQSSSDEPPLFVYNRDIPRINQANPNKPLFPSITTASRPVQGSCAPQSAQVQPTITTERLYHYRPEEIYISSVLPTRTPREVRHFQTNCWNILQENHGPCSFAHNLDDVRKITANPLDFQGLLLRASVNVGPTEINEFYYRIKRSTRL